jgi:sterol desaturase/sphingolipid hydroxylase (fatty acid hydroxylase superfamily)
MNRRKSLERLAPSIRRAHARVTRAWYLSIAHGVLLLALAVHALLRDEPSWVLAAAALVGSAVVPFLGRTAYRGNSFSAFLLLVIVVAPPAWAWLTDRALAIPLAFLLLAPVYYLGLKGAAGLRGRRASRGARTDDAERSARKRKDARS